MNNRFYHSNWELNNENNEKSEEEIEQEWIEHVDYYSDDSIWKFLDDNHPLSTDYEAPDTRKIISDFTTNKSSKFYLRNEAAGAFE